VPPIFTDPTAARIADFVTNIGIPVEAGAVPEDAFLPGLAVKEGRLHVDEPRLAHPGDLLHEAGHIAVAPGWARERLGGEVAVPGVDMNELEFAAIPWSYAAARAIGIDPAVVFHEGGYQGRSEALLANFTIGVPIGVHLLEDAGMAFGARRAQELGVEPYPHMLRWLRE
jgi:hypothetical protein